MISGKILFLALVKKCNQPLAITEDVQGYVWVGTINGLNRFDGNEFKQFYAGDDNKSLPSSFIRNFLNIDNGDLLIGTDKGLILYNPSNGTFFKNEISYLVGEKAIWSLSKNGDEILIGLKNRVIAYNYLENKTTLDSESKNYNEVKKIIKLSDQFFLRNYDGDVYKINQNTEKKLINYSNDITLLNNEVIAATNSGVYLLTNKAELISDAIIKTFSLQEEEKNSELGIIRNNLFNISYNNGRLNLTKIGSLNISEERLNNTLISISLNHIYLSNFVDGFFDISRRINQLRRLNIPESNIWSMIKLDDELLIADNTEKLKSYNFYTKSISEKNNKFTSGPKTLAKIEDKIFIGTSDGLIIKDNITKNEKKILNDIIFSIKIFDRMIFASTFDGVVYKLDPDGSLISKIDTGTGYPIYDTLLDGKILLIASQNGLLKYENSKLEKIFNDDFVFSITKNNNKVYFGTRNSVYLLEKNKITNILNRKKIIYSMTNIDNTITIASNREVIIIDTEKNKNYTLNTSDGSFNDYNTQSALKLNDKVLLGSTEGLLLLDPKLLMLNIESEKSKKINIEEFLLFNTPVKTGSEKLERPINLTKSISLKYSEYPFSFKFNVLGEKSTDFEYFYYLEDLEKDWLSTNGSNTVTYTNLSAGEYTFRLYAEHKFTKKKTDVRSIKVIITPPWWLSNLALGIYTTFVIIIILLTIRAINKRRQTQKQIALSEERLKLSLWGSGDEMWDWDIESGKIYRSNIWGSLDFPQDGRRSGNPDEESNIHPLDRERVAKALNDHFNSITDHFEIAYRVKARNQQWIWILDRAKIVERDQKDQPLRMTGTIKDINNIKQAEEQLRLFARAIENISEGMFILNEKYQFVEVNEACCELTASTHEKYLNETLSFSRYPESYSEQIRTILKQQGSWSGEVEASKGTDDFFLMELTIDAIYNEQGETSHYVGVFSDITRRKQQEEELRKLTNNDLLTGLPNRSSLQVTLSNLVKKDIHHTLMVLDLDNFKRINDSLGHQIGDDLLIGVAERIKLAIPEHASLYRLGGDEFALLVDQFPDIGNCAAIATKVINCLKPAFNINNESLVLGISIGIVLYPEDEQNEQALLRKADIAMYHAKSAGGSRYQFYSESLNQNALRQLEIENLIREALKDDLFEVYYQPKVDVKRDRLAGMEALVRLNHPKLGLIGPNEFIPLAEENGLIVEIGDVVLRKACFAAQKWLESGLFDGRVAVNLSSKQFALVDLQQRIESILRLTKLPAKHLELEITEGTVIKNPEQAIKVMQQLAKMGVSLALDDFGTGYSSLSYLKRFPINCLKIDKTFVDDIDKSDRDLKMVDSIITIAHNMGLSVVGEGVEQTAQLNILKALNCEEIQGYIYSKPIKETDFELMLTADKLKHEPLTQTLMKK
ncbi:diguanylate cyclase [Shewanella saliphila]|uniref:Diguanylate cyclase n=1 Tax=Shewanella saliphila TaxID=2282698 RepID=A0ABQ2Q9N7_9GAMM|nr:diguanylate cyclase [Shewanella saliphila]